MADPLTTADGSQDYGNMVQSNYGDAIGWQTKVEGGNAYTSELFTYRSSQIIAEILQADPTVSVDELVERLRTSDRIIQINTENALAFQTFVESEGTANVGIHLHDFNEEKLDQVLKAFWQSLQPSGVPNNVPQSGVVEFIGREPELEQLHTQLQQGNLLPISAIKGMGGVGKTELAIQYTQRYGDVYKGGIVWLFAREFNVGTQVVDFAQAQLNLKISEGLELPDQVAFCWRNWPEGEVLLVLDDVVNYPCDVELYLPPPTSNRFKVIMTTRLTFGPPIQSISLDVLSPERSLELLTILIGLERVQPELEIAQSLCAWLEHLPLGIELVGRYLLKRTDLSLSTLLFRLREKAEKRQEIRHNALQRDEAMATSTARRGAEAAFELSWKELDAPTQHLGKLLSLFAPAPIPWHLAESVEQKYCENSEGNQEFDVEVFDNARTRLLDLHLLQLSQPQEQIYHLHPLIREFFTHKLEESKWSSSFKQAFCQSIVSVSQQILQKSTTELTSQIAPIIPHLENVATVWKDKLSDDEFLLPFVGLGRFYEAQGDYREAAFWYEACLSESQSRFGESHLAVATSLHNLAYLYWLQARYTKAESLYLKALELNRHLLGENHPDVAINLNDLAYLYESQGRYSEAEPLYIRALALNQSLLGREHPSIASNLSNLASLYFTQGRFAEAEPLYRYALEVNSYSLGEHHPVIASNLNNLANLYYAQARYVEAEVLLVKSLAIREQSLGTSHPDVATSLNNLAALYKYQGRYSEAELLYQRSLELREQLLGRDHPDVATGLNNLAALYQALDRCEEAKALLERSLEIQERLLGQDHPNVATTLNNLAALYQTQGEYEKAEGLLIRALQKRQELLGTHHPETAQSLNNLGTVYKAQNRFEEAISLYTEALKIRRELLGENHPDIASSLSNLASIYLAQGDLNEAKALFQEAFDISQYSLGVEHPLSQELRRNLEAVQ